MRISFLFFLLLASCSQPTETSQTKFYGADSQSTELTFEADVLVKLRNGQTAADLLRDQNQDQVRSTIEAQLQHLFGALTEHDAFRSNPGIVKLKHKITLTNAIEAQRPKHALVTYTYKDTAVFKSRLLRNGPREVAIELPLNPRTIYDDSSLPINEALRKFRRSAGYTSQDLKKRKRQGYRTANLCTDLHYNDEEDFWYFWSPDNPGCSIDRESDLIKVAAQLDPIESTERTYPEYDQLYGDNGNGRKLHVMYLVGIDGNYNNGDLGRQTFEESFAALLANGYTETPESNRFNRVLSWDSGDYEAVVELKLVDSTSRHFVRTAARGIEEADIFIYDGHSGLGEYLALDKIERVIGRPLAPPTDKSQIFYFNGCSTFSYYNQSFFDLKATPQDPAGRENLDIITTSIGALFSIGSRHDIEVINALVDGQKPSWQQIMDNIYDSASAWESALTHVNGDEDNPTQP